MFSFLLDLVWPVLKDPLKLYVQKVPVWLLVVIVLIFAVPMGSMLYLAPGGIRGSLQTYVPAILLSPRAFPKQDNLPLTEEQKSKIKRNIAQLSSQIRYFYRDRKANPSYMNSWAISQTALSVGDKAILSSATFKDALLTGADATAEGWKEFPDARYTHIPATCWSLIALRGSGYFPEKQIRFVLSAQRKSDGAWAVYKIRDIPSNASTYATAWALLTLDKWRSSSLVSEPLKEEISNAIDRGVNWIIQSRRGTSWIWQDYPQNLTEGTPSFSVTGLLMHVLSEVAESERKISVSDFANNFITSIPDSEFTPWSKEVPGIVLPDTVGGPGVKDTVRYYVLPWILVGLGDAYKHANFRGRIRALLFIAPIIDKLDQFTAAMLAENRPWIASEYLIALQYILGNQFI